MTIHLIYPHRNRISAPDVIGLNLHRILRKIDRVVCHEIDSTYRIYPALGDVLIGHPHPFSKTVFRRSMKSPNWSKIIIVQPFNHDFSQVGYIDDLIENCDLFLAITGDYWMDRIHESYFDWWSPRMIQLDLAVDRASFPFLKTSFNPAGKRKFLYIGNDHPGKNISFLRDLAEYAGYRISWAGRGAAVNGLNRLGFLEFSDISVLKKLIADHDFLITVGSFDANPTSILESMSWGLIPICTTSSGYVNSPGIVNISGICLKSAKDTLDHLQYCEQSELLCKQNLGHRLLEERFNWIEFENKIVSALHLPTPLGVLNPPTVKKTFSYHLGTFKLLMRVFLKNLIYRIGFKKWW